MTNDAMTNGGFGVHGHSHVHPPHKILSLSLDILADMT